MPEKLPDGWVKTTFGEIAKPSRDRALPTEVPEMRYVGLEHIEPQTMRLVGYGKAHEVRSSSVRFREGDVLYGKMRPYLNKVWVAEFDGICSAEFLVFPKHDAMNSQFLALRLNGEDFVTFANGQVSGERPRVDFEALSHFPMLLPPSAEQERIVAKLNVLLTKVRRAEMATQRAQERLKRYRAAVLYAAITGEFTRNWRKTHKPHETGTQLQQRLLKARRTRWEEAELRQFREADKPRRDDKWKMRYPSPQPVNIKGLGPLPEGWIWANIEQLASGEPGAIQSGPFGSQLLHSEFRDKGILAIGIDNVLDGSFSMGRQHRITPAKYEQLKKFAARPLDVVITVMATVGRVCVLPKQLETAIITKHCYRISPAFDFVDSDYLAISLRADAPPRQHILGNIRGLTRAGINGSILRAAPVPLPPLLEQTEITREVERRLSAADRLAATLNRQFDHARSTRQSLLQEAFAGHLVHQSPNDKPASFLLDIIHAARETEAKKPKGKRMSKSISKAIRRPLLDVLREHKKPMTSESLFRESGFEAMFNESEEPQDVVDAFYSELRKLTDKPEKVSEQRDSRHQVMLKALL